MLKYVFHLFLFLIFQGWGSVLCPLFFMLIAACLPCSYWFRMRANISLCSFFIVCTSEKLKQQSWSGITAVHLLFPLNVSATRSFVVPSRPSLRIDLTQGSWGEGGSYLKVQPNANNRGRDVLQEKPLFPHSFSNIFHLLLLFLFFLPVMAKYCSRPSSD